MPRGTHKDPDHLLSRANYPQLNQAFYATNPYDYFHQRLLNLLLVAAKPRQLDRLCERGVTFSQIRFPSRLRDESPDAAQKRHERFVLTEAEVLLHHATEALLRLYLAHEPTVHPDGSVRLPPCPWLQVARLRDADQFRKQITTRLLTDNSPEKLRTQHTVVFYGAQSPDLVTPRIDDERWQLIADNLMKAMSFLARYYLDHSDLYNAAKHGLVVRAGESSVSLGYADGEKLLSASGASIEYLHIGRNRKGLDRWNRTTVWIDVPLAMVMCDLALRMIKSLWSVAQAHYLNMRPFHVEFLDKLDYEVLLPSEGIHVGSMSMPLIYGKEPAKATRRT